jgi:hypothetical protein
MIRASTVRMVYIVCKQSEIRSDLVDGFARLNLRTISDNADGRDDGEASIIRVKPQRSNGGSAADDADPKHPAQSAPDTTGRR